MSQKNFIPFHINATAEDFAGNEGIGRYLLLPGSDGRAKEVAENFKSVEVKQHSRGHHLYKGKLMVGKKSIDVAAISTGMGCPSMEIILHELFHLGAKRFLRIGTAGALQPWIRPGDLINVQASVRDEDTTSHYAPLEFPAIASLEFASSVLLAAEKTALSKHVHTGIVHCKSSLYAREFGAGPKSSDNESYKALMTQLGVLASEMETASLFIQSQFYNHQVMNREHSPQDRVLAGAILAIVASLEESFTRSEEAKIAIQESIQLGLESVKTLAQQELFH